MIANAITAILSHEPNTDIENPGILLIKLKMFNCHNAKIITTTNPKVVCAKLCNDFRNLLNLKIPLYLYFKMILAFLNHIIMLSYAKMV